MDVYCILTIVPQTATIAPPQTRRRSRLLILFVACALGVPAGFISAHAVRVPIVKALEDYQPAIITRVYDREGVPFAEYAIQKRIVVAKRDMAPMLVNAIVATEDADFYQHGGFNPKAILRAGLKDLIARKKVEGASTLTQQPAGAITSCAPSGKRSTSTASSTSRL